MDLSASDFAPLVGVAMVTRPLELLDTFVTGECLSLGHTPLLLVEETGLGSVDFVVEWING